MIGDLLLTFNKDATTWHTRTKQPWQATGSFGCARLWTSQPDETWRGSPWAISEDDQWVVWSMGEFFGSQPGFPRALEDPNDLNGHYLLIAYDKLNQCWHILTDRLGTMHAYRTLDAGSVTIGTFSPALASSLAVRALDWEAIGGFLRFGFFLGDKTYWKNVRLIRPATRLVMDRDGQVVSETQYWTWHFQPEQTLSFEEALGKFSEVFSEVVREMAAAGTLALPLSGGLDSRSTLAVLGCPNQAGTKSLYPFSYGYSDRSVETVIARQLAEKRNLPVRIWTIQPYLFQKLDQIISSVEGFQDITQCRQAFVVEDLSRHADAVLAAHWGDVWLDSVGLVGQPPCTNSELGREIFQKIQKKGSSELCTLMRGVLPAGWETAAQAEIEKSLNALGTIREKDFLIKAWKTAQWSHRWTLASIRMYQAGLFPRLPFYDNRLVDCFLRISSEHMTARRLQIEYIKRTAPDLAQVRWQAYDANLYNYKYFDTWLLAVRAAKKAARVLRNQRTLQRNWEVQFLNTEGRLGLSRWLLEGGLKLHQFVAPKQLEEVLQAFYRSPDGANGYTVSMLLTLSVWLEKYG